MQYICTSSSRWLHGLTHTKYVCIEHGMGWLTRRAFRYLPHDDLSHRKDSSSSIAFLTHELKARQNVIELKLNMVIVIVHSSTLRTLMPLMQLPTYPFYVSRKYTEYIRTYCCQRHGTIQYNCLKRLWLLHLLFSPRQAWFLWIQQMLYQPFFLNISPCTSTSSWACRREVLYGHISLSSPEHHPMDECPEEYVKQEGLQEGLKRNLTSQKESKNIF